MSVVGFSLRASLCVSCSGRVLVALCIVGHSMQTSDCSLSRQALTVLGRQMSTISLSYSHVLVRLTLRSTMGRPAVQWCMLAWVNQLPSMSILLYVRPAL